MKQHFLLSTLFICTFIASTQAQIKKGSIWLGGNIGYSQNKADYEINPDYKYRSLFINPAIGVALKDNLIAGIMITYQDNRLKNTGNTTDLKETYKGAGIFVRQYVPIVNRLYIFGEANATYKSFRAKETRYYNNNQKINTKGWDAGLSITPGLSFVINKKIQLESGFNSLFQIMQTKRNATSDVNGYDTKSESFAAGIFLENESYFYVGFRFLLNNKG